MMEFLRGGLARVRATFTAAPVGPDEAVREECLAGPSRPEIRPIGPIFARRRGWFTLHSALLCDSQWVNGQRPSSTLYVLPKPHFRTGRRWTALCIPQYVKDFCKRHGVSALEIQPWQQVMAHGARTLRC